MQILTALNSHRRSSMATLETALCASAIALLTRPPFLARSAKVGKLWQQDQVWRVAEALYLYATPNLFVQPRKIDKNVVDSGHVRKYRSASVVRSVITLTSVSNYNNVTQSHKVRYARSTATLWERFIGGYCTCKAMYIQEDWLILSAPHTHPS